MLHQLSSYGFLQHENDIPQNFTTLQIQAHEERHVFAFIHYWLILKNVCQRLKTKQESKRVTPTKMKLLVKQ
jgi:hypothetical protein